MNIDDLRSAAASLAFALEKYPEKVSIVPVKELLMEAARQNAKRPAYVKIAVNDDTVKALRGPADKTDEMLLLVSIPKDVQERSESSIILPGEV